MSSEEKNSGSQSASISRNELLRLKKERIAVITIGRWQPPHAGHLELLDGTRDKVLDLRKKGFKNVDGFVWITPRPDETPGKTVSDEIINKNPLYFIDKWFYLNYILPYDEYGKDLKFLTITNIDNDINEKIFYDTQNKASFLTKSHELRSQNRINALSECQQEKYSSLFYYGNDDYKKFLKRTVRINTRNQSKSPSETCINFLKKRGYNQLLLLVGSDRVDAFERYNREHLDSAFGAGNGIIEQIGAERGSAGRGMLFDLGTESGDENDVVLAAGIMEQCSISGQGCDSDSSSDEGKSPVSIAGRFSGTRIRNCAYNLDDLDYFCEGTILGDMTKESSFCLLNDLRSRHKPALPPITKYDWNDLVSTDYSFFSVNKSDELYSRLAIFNAMYGSRGGNKKKTRKKRKKKSKRNKRKTLKKKKTTRKQRKKRKSKTRRKKHF